MPNVNFDTYEAVIWNYQYCYHYVLNLKIAIHISLMSCGSLNTIGCRSSLHWWPLLTVPLNSLYINVCFKKWHMWQIWPRCCDKSSQCTPLGAGQPLDPDNIVLVAPLPHLRAVGLWLLTKCQFLLSRWLRDLQL